MSRDDSAPRVIAPERAARIKQPPDWPAIAKRLAGALRNARDTHAEDAPWCEQAGDALDEYERAFSPPPPPKLETCTRCDRTESVVLASVPAKGDINALPWTIIDEFGVVCGRCVASALREAQAKGRAT